MAQLFKIPNALIYQGDTKNWKKFKQQFDIYLKATGFQNNNSESKVNIFLNIGGEEALEIFENLNLTPEEKKDYDVVLRAFDTYCSSKHNEIYKSFKFFTRVQQPSEFFSEFYEDLLVMASYCNFGDQKDRLVRDRIIAGIKNSVLQEQFLKSPDLTLDEVVKVCHEDDIIKIQTRNLKFEKDDTYGGEDSDDDESNNNYDVLSNLDSSEVSLNTFEQIHIPDEILFNDMENEEGFVEDMDLMDIQSDINDTEHKPIEISNIYEKKNENLCNDTKKTTEKPEKRTRSSLKQSNEDVQTKNANVKKKVDAVMKNESLRKPSRAKRKTCGHSLKIECKEEPNEKADDMLDSYNIPIEDQDEYSQIESEDSAMFSLLNNEQDVIEEHVEESQITNDNSLVMDYENLIEDRDEYTEKVVDDNDMFHSEEQNTTEVEDYKEIHENSIIIEYQNDIEDQDECSQICNENSEVSVLESQEEFNEQEQTNCGNSISSLETMNEMAEAEFMLEKDTSNSSSNTDVKKGRGKGTKVQMIEYSKHPQIVKVKRDNLPPLILKSFRKKKFLLGKMPFSCKKCDSAFWTQFQLERHQLVHVLKKAPPPSKPPSKVFKCEECGKEFKKICDLERHTRVHTGEKPSVCNICNKRFQQPYNLNKHLYTHTQEKNFECVICQKKFGRNDVLNRHVLTHSIVKPFKCSVCSRTFIRNSQLKLHLRKYHDLDEDPGNETNDVDDAVASTSTD